MYGMVNQAVRELVVEYHGEVIWDAICAEADLTETDFESLRKYPDEVTYRLVGAASRVLSASPEAILEVFGEYWTEFAGRTSFSRLLRFGGNSFEEFVRNLDHMHAKIKFSLPELDPPSFRVADAGPGGFRLQYYSGRPGLAPLVKGMMQGVAKMYGVTIDMRLDRSRADGLDHDSFTIRYADPVVVPAAAE